MEGDNAGIILLTSWGREVNSPRLPKKNHLRATECENRGLSLLSESSTTPDLCKKTWSISMLPNINCKRNTPMRICFAIVV